MGRWRETEHNGAKTTLIPPGHGDSFTVSQRTSLPPPTATATPRPTATATPRSTAPPNGTACDDGNLNTVNDTWVDGICVGTPVTATATSTPTVTPTVTPVPTPTATATPRPTGSSLTLEKALYQESVAGTVAIDDPQHFSFTTTGTGLSNFTLDDNPASTTPPSSITFSNLGSGTYTVSEDILAGWTVSGINCGGVTTGGTFTFPNIRTINMVLAPGAAVNVTCTFNGKRS